eukprot:CAMPEP_0197659194 /NCGR_PEP_ID=MMETSP1338-20131121/46535_1 /TAXON_ID=43686 ORGANISM="Pelagodinium beii, Strain RCC1491" /NCGR_SAMPLE_ID=MMETSP1338 /ASSEMBLY_ACC=CAM_ASM_000754 /LENGTH=30 /DNA_ID= /DNA_START= /DNA_END= /DNA_ORIENTATION=
MAPGHDGERPQEAGLEHVLYDLGLEPWPGA